MRPTATGGYFRVSVSIDDLPEDSLVLAWMENGQIQAQQGERYFHYTDEQFAQHFVPAPEGRMERMRQLNQLMEEAHTVGHSPAFLQLTDGGETSTPNALITVEKKNSLVETKRSALIAKKRLEVINALRQGILKEQTQEIALAAAKLGAQLAEFTYAIQTINLYLGRDEDIVCIQEGEGADPQQPLCIRQTVLFMDEETALHAEAGGLDFNTLADFDHWLRQPKHLQQILPEEKGIVALRLRREEKYYANSEMWERMMMQIANGGTYLLVRNGQRLWRIWNDIELPAHLYPTKQEFEALFRDRWTDEPLRPGSHGYQEALDRAVGLQKQYLQAILILQGILDRTQIFKPLPVERVNLLDPQPDPNVVRLIRDAENLLSSGKPGYLEWMRGVNSKLEVGKRIVFGGTSYRRHSVESRKYNESRTQPKFIDWPDHHVIYSLNGKSDQCDFTFSFSRPGYKAKGSFHVYRSDTFILNFDDVTEEELVFYLEDRCNRHHYLDSFPLLQATLKLKQQEQDTEKPFVALLIREARQRYALDEESARRQITAIIPWFKQKNQISRNLTQDEKAAYKQILDEVRRRQEIKCNPATQETALRIQQQRPDWLVIAKDSGNTVVCLSEVPFIRGLVTREQWDTSGQQCLATTEWYMPNSEYARWESLASDARWEAWPKHGRRGDFLSEPEYQQLLAQLQDYMDQQKKRKELTALVAISVNHRYFFAYGLMKRHAWGRANLEWVTKRIPWKRGNHGQLELDYHHMDSLDGCLTGIDKTEDPNNPIVDAHTPHYELYRLKELTPTTRRLPFTAHGYRVCHFDEKALQTAQKYLRIQAHRRGKERTYAMQTRHLMDSVQAELDRRFWDREKTKYLADGGVMELWQDHQKTVRYKPFDLSKTDLEDCLYHVVTTSGARILHNQRIEDLWSIAERTGWMAKSPEANSQLPKNVVLPPVPDKD